MHASSLGGLPPALLRQLEEVFSRYPEVSGVRLYGSRAKGTHRTGSDIDLAVDGSDLSIQMLNRIHTALDDLMSPYSFDLTMTQTVKNPDLLDHINRVGIVVYERGGTLGCRP